MTNRTAFASRLRGLSTLSFSAMVVFIPWRIRTVLIDRPLEPIYSDYTDVLLFASDILLLVTLGLWTASLALKPRRLGPGPAFLWVPIAGVTLMGWVSALFSVDPALSFYHSVRIGLMGGLYLYVANEIHDLSRIGLPVVVMILTQSGVAIAQGLSQSSLGLQRLGEYSLDPAWSGVSVVATQTERTLRAYGLSDHPNILGGCLAFGLIVVAALHLRSSDRRQALNLFTFALGSAGLFLTYSRAAALAFITGLGFIAALMLQNRRTADWWKLVRLLGAGALTVVPLLWMNSELIAVRAGLGGSFDSVVAENRSLSERTALNEAANRIFADHALSGVGLGALPLAMHARYPEFPYFYQPAHIALLDAAAETGIFGGLFYAAAIVTPWLALWWVRRRSALSPDMIGASALLLAVTIVGFFDYYTWLLPPGRLWLWLAWGLWAAQFVRIRAGETLA